MKRSIISTPLTVEDSDDGRFDLFGPEANDHVASFSDRSRAEEVARILNAHEAMAEVLSTLLHRVERNGWSRHGNVAEAKMRERVVKQARAVLALAKGEEVKP